MGLNTASGVWPRSSEDSQNIAGSANQDDATAGELTRTSFLQVETSILVPLFHGCHHTLLLGSRFPGPQPTRFSGSSVAKPAFTDFPPFSFFSRAWLAAVAL